MIDLSKIEDSTLREQLREQIKADKQAAVEKRLAKIKVDEETQAKLAKLASYETAEQEAKLKAENATKLEQSDTYLKEQGLQALDSFKELKSYDAFMELDTDEDKNKFLEDLKTSKPGLFKREPKYNPLDLANANLKMVNKKEELKIY